MSLNIHVRNDDSAHARTALLNAEGKALALNEPLIEELNSHRVYNAGAKPI